MNRVRRWLFVIGMVAPVAPVACGDSDPAPSSQGGTGGVAGSAATGGGGSTAEGGTGGDAGTDDGGDAAPDGPAPGPDGVQSLGSATWELTPTFESMGIRADFSGDTNENAVCHVAYRKQGDATWRGAHDLIVDRNRMLLVGSVVSLQPGQTYEFRLSVDDPDGTVGPVTATSTTWSDPLPEGVHELIESGQSPVTITEGGSASGYRVVAPDVGSRATLDVGAAHERAMVIDSDHVIVRNIDFVGGSQNAIFIKNDRHDIVIEDCTFTRFGAEGKASGPGTLADEQDNAAVLVGDSWGGSGVARVVIQRNTFFEPNGGSNSWDDGHPTGPHAIYLLETDGNHVIRYNHIHSVADRWYNDCIGGGQNSSTEFGNANRDSDIYGNVISQCWDDAIEVEGRNENVRVWGNFIEHAHVAVASGAVTVGPLYVFRNVFIENDASEADSDARSTAFKCGYNEGIQGPQFTFFNTLTGPREAMHAISGSAGPVYNHRSRSNIFDVASTVVSDETDSLSNSFDCDLLREGATFRAGDHNYTQAVYGRPVFAPTEPSGSPYARFLEPGSPGYRAGCPVPNFADGPDGTALADPDMGAFDSRLPPLRFGPEMQ